MKSTIRCWWRNSLAAEIWNDLTPLGRVVLWPPSVLMGYTYILLLSPFTLIEWAYGKAAGKVYNNPDLRTLFWRGR